MMLYSTDPIVKLRTCSPKWLEMNKVVRTKSHADGKLSMGLLRT